MGVSSVSGMASSSRAPRSSELTNEGKQSSVLHGNILDQIFLIMLVTEITGNYGNI